MSHVSHPRLAGLCLGAVLGISTRSAAEAPPESAAAPEQATEPPRSLLPKVRFGGHGSFTWEGGFGLGARLDFPILREQAMFSEGRDELAISTGADIIFLEFAGSDRVSAWPTATVQWSLSATEDFTFFPELGLVAHIAHDGWDGFYPNIGFGGRYYVYRSLSVVGRLGWPMALSLGAAF